MIGPTASASGYVHVRQYRANWRSSMAAVAAIGLWIGGSAPAELAAEEVFPRAPITGVDHPAWHTTDWPEPTTADAALRDAALERAVASGAADPAAHGTSITVDRAELERIVAEIMAEQAAAQPKTGGGSHVVGEDLDLPAKYNHGFEARTRDKAFRIRIGGRVHLDSVWLAASDAVDAGLRAPTPGQPTIGTDDAVAVRRGRFRVDGTLYEFMDFATEFEFANSVNDNSGVAGQPASPANVIYSPAPTDLYWAVREVPIVGNVRIGNFKEPIGLEHLTSSRYLDFIERAYNQDAFTLTFNNGFAPGIAIHDTFLEQQGTWNIGVFKNTTSAFAYGIGEGEYATTGRVTYLPYFDEPSDGRYFVHIGGAASIRDTDNSQLRVRSRGSLRNGPSAINPVLADTGTFFSEQQDVLASELLIGYGAWIVQAEYIVSFAQDSYTNVGGNRGAALGTVQSHGYYVETLYFLTGEHRTYNRETAVLGRVIPFTNFWLTRDGCGDILFGSGAWQAGARYSYLDLDDPGLDGGVIQDVTLGLNWYWNPNTKVQFNYVYAHRDVAEASFDGDIHGCGVRFAHDF